MTDVSADIEQLSLRRQAIWRAGGGSAGEVASLARRLADLYEIKRCELAQRRTGRSHAEIMRQARVESELERLISR